jgi:peptidoglycan/xylan/chitin deacetylase (PgdA/CDA1 family)
MVDPKGDGSVVARRSHTNSTRTIAERLRGSLWAPVVFMTVVLTAAAVLVAIQTRRPVSADKVDCRQAKCVALTFDDGPSPFTDRLLGVLSANGAKATFFLIGNKVARDPAAAKRIADAGMEIGSHTWEHPNMSTIAPDAIPRQLSAATSAIADAVGSAPKIYRPAGGLSNDAVRAEAGRQGLAEILWDVIPFDWINDSNLAATVYMLTTQIKPGSVVLLHDTYSSTVDLVYQFLPVLIANGYHMVTVSHLLGPRQPGTSYGGRENGPPVNEIRDIPPNEIPALPATPSPKPAPNLPITDLPNQNPGGPQ